MSQSRHVPASSTAGGGISVVRTGLAALLVVVGIAWVVLYATAGNNGDSLTWMFDLGDWNWLIGFGLIFVGLALASDSRTPLGRGRGVVTGMLGCFLIGLAWIVVYYVFSNNDSVWLVKDLGNYNLLVGIGFMATGFVYATKWE